MKRNEWTLAVLFSITLCAGSGSCTFAADNSDWPPRLAGAENGTVHLKSALFLQTADAVKTAAEKEGAASFTVATTVPTVDLAFHGPLPNQALNGTGWSAWGDICVADNGAVYCGVGDHGDAKGGNSHCFIFRWDPKTRTLEKIVDVNGIVPRRLGEPTWSKVHARIVQGSDGWVYFNATLNDGNRAGQPGYKWSDAVPGGQLYRYDPRTGKAEVFADLPAARASATCLLDCQRDIWWCNLESGPNALFALDLRTKAVRFKAPDGSMSFNRNFALARDGSVYFNGKGGIWKYDPAAQTFTKVGDYIGWNTCHTFDPVNDVIVASPIAPSLDTKFSGRTYVFNLSTNQWEARSTSPLPHFGTGIQAWDLYGSATITPNIQNNFITRAETGIYLFSQAFGGSVDGTIHYNTLYDNNYGIVLRMHRENPLIANNIITGSANGIHLSYEDGTLLTDRLAAIMYNDLWSNTNNIWCNALSPGSQSIPLSDIRLGPGNISGDPEYYSPPDDYTPENPDCHVIGCEMGARLW